MRQQVNKANGRWVTAVLCLTMMLCIAGAGKYYHLQGVAHRRMLEDEAHYALLEDVTFEDVDFHRRMLDVTSTLSDTVDSAAPAMAPNAGMAPEGAPMASSAPSVAPNSTPSPTVKPKSPTLAKSPAAVSKSPATVGKSPAATVGKSPTATPALRRRLLL